MEERGEESGLEEGEGALATLLAAPATSAAYTRTTLPEKMGEASASSSTSGDTAEGETGHRCAACSLKIADRYLLKAMDKFWHEDCLKCGCCGCRLAEAGSSMFYKQNMLLCKRDYLRLFGVTGMCAACGKVIPAFEMVMRARSNVYHLECFACQECSHRFCVGDKFYLCEGKILCEYDYEERMLFAQMAYNYNSLAQLKRQFQDDDMSQEDLHEWGINRRDMSLSICFTILFFTLIMTCCCNQCQKHLMRDFYKLEFKARMEAEARAMERR